MQGIDFWTYSIYKYIINIKNYKYIINIKH